MKIIFDRFMLQICDRVKNRGYTVVQDAEGRMGPYAYKDRDWVSYDDINMLKKKVAFHCDKIY
jgi:chitinase